ncbi:MAG: alpha-2-macroglobulin family protein [Bacteroidetes bacterium]|nr:alpha-2-macroglobulin family protein [Bacteroidota bacterium]
MLVITKKAAAAQSYVRYILFFMLLALSACKNKENEVTLVAHNFGDELIAEQSLNFTFSRKLVSDSVIGNFVNESLLKITPSVSGRTKWISDHEFSFTPSERFAPNTAYTIELVTAQLLKSNKQLNFSGNSVFKAATAGLMLNNVSFHWLALPAQANKAILKMQLDFNYKINPAEVLRFLKVTSGGTELAVKSASTSISESLEFELENVPESDDDQPALIKIEKGLPIPYSQSTAPAPITYESIIPSKSKVTITDVQTEHTGTIGSIMIYTSVELEESTLAKSITVNPDVVFEITKTDYGCMLTSENFEINSTYRLAVATSLQSALGGTLKSSFEQDLVFGKLNPSISFVSNKAMYLGSKGFRNVLVNITSIPKVKVMIYKVYENNMLQFLSKGIQYDGYYDYDEDYYYDYQSFSIDDYGDLIYSQEVETKTLEKRNASRILHFDFEDKAKNVAGVYVVQVQSADQQWVQASKVMSISDIGLIVKESPQAVTVFANSISAAKSLSGVKVGLVTSKNQPIKTITTNSDGVAVFDKPEGVFPDYKVGLITASNGSDYNFIKLNYSNRIEQARFDVGGKYITEQVYDAYIYGDRDLYRPGETMHLAAIVRDMKWQKPGEMPVRFRILMPNGREFKSIKKILDEQGSCMADVPIPAAAVTGTYQVELYSAAREPIGRKSISVEEFMPDKIAVKLELSKKRFALGDSVVALATATNLFGPPAANRNYKAELTMGNQYFQSKKYSQYNFSLSRFDRSFSIIERSGTTNSNGQWSEGFFMTNEYANHGILKGRIFATVFDESGRPVNRESSFELITQPYLLGIDMADNYVSLDVPVTINLCAVNADDKPMTNAKAKVTIVRKEWYSVMERYGNGYRYNSQYRDIIQLQKEIVINSQTSLPFTPLYNGSYEVHVSLPGSNNYVTNYFYAYSFGRTNNNSFEVNNEGNIDIEADKEKYKVGDKVKLLFKTPFVGKMIVTIEQDKVLNHYSISTDNKSATLDFTLKDEHLPNIYVNAIVIRPQDDGSNPLVVASGVKSIIVENPTRKLDLKIEAATQSRSRTKQSVRVQTTPNTPVTIAVVDEGILQIKNYKSPNPYDFFYAQRALGVTSYNIYPMLFNEVMSKRTATGGDEFDLAKRVNPITNKRVNLVALWSGIIQSDKNGMAEFSFDIPQFNGSLRIMAVSFKDQKFNGTETFMKVADPIVINSGLPRFASPGDTIIMPVTLSNTTASAITGKVSITATGPFKVVDNPGEVNIKPNSESQLKLRVYTQQVIGAGTITTTVYAGKETFKEEVNMTSRPATS